LARRLGATDAIIAALERSDLAALSDADSAAIRYAEMVTPTGSTADDVVYQGLARHWAPEQIVEITAVIALFNYFNRFAEALHVPVTR
jgi:alkylhydroperoxidase family enzyme